MDFRGTKRSGGVSKGVGGLKGKRVSAMPLGVDAPQISLYQDPPDQALSLDDFEGLAVERLRVLAGVEQALSRGTKPHELATVFDELTKGTHLALRDTTSRREDNFSHWVLRLAFSSARELRTRFLAFEVYLFNYRFDRLGRSQVQAFIHENELGYKPISSSERDTYMPELQALQAATKWWVNEKASQTEWYKVPFTEVLPLVAKRTCFVTGGMAYVPQMDILSILSQRFRTSLSQQLATACKSLPIVKQDERIAPIIGKLQHAYLGPNFGKQGSAANGEMNPAIVDKVAKTSFPMCMRQLHHAFKHDHHLRYQGRLQFRLFLKGLGLSMEDCLVYFQREFQKKGISPEDFQKKYSYNIRHSYGQEGKRADYTPYNCVRIVLGPQPGAGEHHGCPFRTFDETTMRKALQTGPTAMSGAAISSVTDLMKSGHFQVACRRHFELSHPGAQSGSVGEHPNAWYEASSAYWQEKEQKDTAATSENNSTQPTSQPTSQPNNQSSSQTPMDVNAAASTTSPDPAAAVSPAAALAPTPFVTAVSAPVDTTTVVAATVDSSTAENTV